MLARPSRRPRAGLGLRDSARCFRVYVMGLPIRPWHRGRGLPPWVAFGPFEHAYAMSEKACVKLTHARGLIMYFIEAGPTACATALLTGWRQLAPWPVPAPCAYQRPYSAPFNASSVCNPAPPRGMITPESSRYRASAPHLLPAPRHQRTCTAEPLLILRVLSVLELPCLV